MAGDQKMPLANGIKDDIKAAKKIRLPWWGILCLAIGSFLMSWLFDHFGKLTITLPTLNSILILVFAIALKWKLRRRAWFWMIMAVIAALHVPLILFVPWGDRWIPALVIGAIDSVDLCAILWILSVVGKFVEGPKTLKDERPFLRS
jgi:hypothetical protein